MASQITTALSGYATQAWVTAQSYATTSALSTAISGLSSVYTTTAAVASQITTALTGYATQAWVTAQSYATTSGVSYSISSAISALGLGTAATQNSTAFDANGSASSAQAYSIQRANHTGTQPSSTISDKGVAGGVASLDGGGKVPVSQLPSSLMQYIGAWNASTNTPTLSNGTGIAGNVYNVTVAGTVLGETWNVGDWAIYNGSVWERSPNADDLLNVNGKTGAVVLTTTDISEGTNLYFTTARAIAAVTWSTLTGIPAWIVAATSYGQSLITATNAAAVKTLLSLSSSDVGLGNVNNTSDANKPVSTAQAAINATLAPLASPALTGTPTAPTQAGSDNSTKLATTAFVTVAIAALSSVYTTASAVASQITTALTGYATQAWVTAQGYITSASLSGLISLSSALTGLGSGTNAAITSSDTVLSAFAKLQNQVSALVSAGYQTASQVTTAITSYGYQTASQVTSAIVAYGYDTVSARTSAISALSSVYTTTSAVASQIVAYGYQTASQVTTAITSYGYQTAAQVTTAITSYGYQTAANVTSAITAYGYATLSSLLTGLSTATSAAVTATDSILVAFGKLQSQINTITAAGYQTASQVTAAITSYGYQTASNVSSAIATALSTYATQSFVTSAITALGLGTASTKAISFFLQSSNNLSDLASASTARSNLGLGTAATQNSTAFDASGSASSAQSYAIQRANHTGTQPSSTISDKGVAGGVASLDGGGKVPVSQLPSSLMQYIGVWNASTNTPTLSNGTGIAGNVYNVTVAGTLLGETWNVGDWAIYNGSIWERSPNADDLLSVNGKTGAVVLTTSDISEGTNLYFTTARAISAVTWSTLTGIPAWIVAATSYGQSLIAATNAAAVKTLLGLTSSDVGLGNVNNTSDANKPVSTAQAAINATLAPLASPALTGTPTAPTQAGSDNSTKLATTAFVTAAIAALSSVYTTASAVASQITTALTGYATQSWVTAQGYITSASMSGLISLSSALTGLGSGTNAAITSSDTVLSAFAKLQNQVSALVSAGYQTASQVTTAITSYGYQTASQVTSAIVAYGYDTVSARTSAISALSSVYTTTSAVASQIVAYGYQTASQVNTAITSYGYQTASQVTTAITGYGYQTAAQVTTAITTGNAATANAVAPNSVTPAGLSSGGPYWNAAGNVGIGTTSPAVPLHVAGSYPAIYTSDGTVSMRIVGVGGVGYVGTLSNNPLEIHTNNVVRLTIDGNGVIDASSNPIVNCLTTAKAWVNFNGTTGTIRSSYNVSSVTMNATGKFTVNFANPMADANYSISGVTSQPTSLGNGYTGVTLPFNIFPTTNSFQVYMTGPSAYTTYATALVNIQVFGN